VVKYPITPGSSFRARKHGPESCFFILILCLWWNRQNKEGNVITATTSGYHLEGYDPVDDIAYCVKERRV
jgi:hypothetical protein